MIIPARPAQRAEPNRRIGYCDFIAKVIVRISRRRLTTARSETMQMTEEEYYRKLSERCDEDARVEAERARTDPSDRWWPIRADEIPDGLTWTTTPYSDGLIVQTSYGEFNHGGGDRFKCIHDRSDNRKLHYRRREVQS